MNFPADIQRRECVLARSAEVSVTVILTGAIRGEEGRRGEVRDGHTFPEKKLWTFPELG